MLVLISIGLLAGLVAGVSPCVLPVLPVIFFSGGVHGRLSAGETGRFRRPLAIITGLAVSFAIVTLAGAAVLTAVGLPQDVLRWAGLVVLVLVGLGLLSPRLEQLLQRPFEGLPKLFGSNSSGRPAGSGFVLGLGLGTLYVPCAGPVLAAISVAGTTGHVTGGIAALTIAFSLGVALPLAVFATAGAGVYRRLASYRRRSRHFRIAGGVTMVLLAVALTFNLTDGLQRAVPPYTQALQDRVENNSAARQALSDATATGPVVSCLPQARTLANCGPAPQFVGIQNWLNTERNKPVTLTELRGKVVLVNFWTYSCINCQRALPTIKAWYADYHSSGLEIIGVHTPEFAYEHELSNVQGAVRSDGIEYPVGLDNSSATWRNFDNSYWPAEYLIDAGGVLRHVVYGEGGYADSEALIRELLRAANPEVILPAPTDPVVPAG